MSKDISHSVIPTEFIEQKIFLIRGQKVMFDVDLAELYSVPVKSLIQSVKRNRDRFPDDFIFQLSQKEFINLRSQFVTSSWGGRRYAPHAFTEHGVAMLSSVLKSKRAIEVNIYIIRAFIKLRELMATNKDFSNKFAELEREQRLQNQHINKIYSIIGKLLKEPQDSPDPIGFDTA